MHGVQDRASALAFDGVKNKLGVVDIQFFRQILICSSPFDLDVFSDSIEIFFADFEADNDPEYQQDKNSPDQIFGQARIQNRGKTLDFFM